jgi:predicted Zn-dependent peptidase
MSHEVKKYVYANGLTLIVDEAPQLMSVAIAAWVKTGSRHEDLDSWGMCHFLEHMIFKGSKKRHAHDISKAVDRVGGDFNAFTSREHTCFHFYLPARELKLGASLLKDVLFRPLFAAKEIEREREVILQEIAMVKENPEEQSFDDFLEKSFGKHPLGRQILGSAESISGLNRKKVFEFFYEHYRPENMMIAVSGAVTFEKAKRELAILGDTPWPNRKKPLAMKARWGVDPPEGTQPGFWWVNSDTEQAHVLWGMPAPVSTAKDRIISTILQQYLGGGMSSVLFDEIREKKGWAYTVYASAVQFLDSSIFTVYAGVKVERALDTLLVCQREMRKIARAGIPSAELKRIKESLLCSFVLSQESSESRMMAISNHELFFRKELSFKEFEKIMRSIRVSDTQVLMNEWMKAGKPTLYVLGKKPRARAVWNRIKAQSIQLTGQALIYEKSPA